MSLIDVVDSDVIEDSGMLDDPDVQQALIPLLAPGQENLEELREIVSKFNTIYSIGYRSGERSWLRASGISEILAERAREYYYS